MSLIDVQYGAASDPGRVRPVNEDSFVAASPVFFVADGMGGHEAGDVASAIVASEFASLAGREAVELVDVTATLQRARARVDALAHRTPRAAGTTLTGVSISDVAGVPHWLVVNIGDSRTYRFADGTLTQISVDHSAAQEAADAGADASEIKRNIITRAIGAGSDGEADTFLLAAAPGDRILACSDGLTGEVSDERIAEVLASVLDAQQAVNLLIAEANANGGRDNVTVVIVDAGEVAGSADVEEDTAPGARRA